MLEDFYTEEEETQERALEAKERKNIIYRQELEKKIFRLNAEKTREKEREAHEAARAEARKERSIQRIDELKAELDDELDAYIEHPTHIPLKQALANHLRPVPTVTTLLAALRDQEEDFDDLKATNLEERSKGLKKPLFIYVQELKDGHERVRLKPPEPEIDEKRQRAKQNQMNMSGQAGKGSPNTTKGSSTGFGNSQAARGVNKENKSPAKR